MARKTEMVLVKKRETASKKKKPIDLSILMMRTQHAATAVRRVMTVQARRIWRTIIPGPLMESRLKSPIFVEGVIVLVMLVDESSIARMSLPKVDGFLGSWC